MPGSAGGARGLAGEMLRDMACGRRRGYCRRKRGGIAQDRGQRRWGVTAVTGRRRAACRSDRHFLSSTSLVGDHRRSTAGRNAAARLSGSARPEEPSDGAPPIQRDDGGPQELPERDPAGRNISTTSVDNPVRKQGPLPAVAARCAGWICIAQFLNKPASPTTTARLIYLVS